MSHVSNNQNYNHSYANSSPGKLPITSFEINVKKDTFKFNAAHFVAFPGFRERLHGHNYTIAIRLLGSRKIGYDGYLVDFGDVKKVAKDVCKELNEHFLCPMFSDSIKITVEKSEDEKIENIRLVCEDGAEFVFPKGDCAMLPIVHATAEELAIYIWGKVVSHLDAYFLTKRGIHTMEVTCAEAVGQEAVFRMEIPSTNDKKEVMKRCDVKSYITTGVLFPKPCFSVQNNGILDKPAVSTANDKDDTDDHCENRCSVCQGDFAKQMQAIVDAINTGSLDVSQSISVKDLEKEISKRS